MYHVSAQGVDERMINVHYYYCKTIQYKTIQYKTMQYKTMQNKTMQNKTMQKNSTGKCQVIAQGVCHGAKHEHSQINTLS